MTRERIVIILQVVFTISLCNGQSCTIDSLVALFNQKLYSKPTEALKFTDQIDSTAKEDKDQWYIAQSLNLKGMVYNVLGDTEKALAYFIASQKKFKALGVKRQVAALYNNIGAVYNNLDDNDKTIEMYKLALDYFESVKDSTWLPKILYNLSTQYNSKNDFAEDIRLKDAAEAILAKKPNKVMTSYITPNYAHTLLTLGRVKEAKQKIEPYLADTSLLIYPSVTANAMVTYSYILDSLRQYDKAIQVTQEALQLANEGEFSDIIQKCNLQLARLYEIQGQSSTALSYYKQYFTLYENENKEEKNRIINEMVTKYETRKKEDKIEILSAKNELQAVSIKQANTQRWLLFAGVIGLLILSVLLFYLMRIKSSTNQKLNQKNTLISNALAEKDILLREIHHRVKNNLQVISSLLKLQSNYITDENAIKAIAAGRARVNSMAILHQNLYKDDNITGVDMQSYFSNLIETLFDTYNIKTGEISLHTHIANLTLDIDTVIPLGLIVNELISNALKHAYVDIENASLEVRLWEQDKLLYLAVNDNGIGHNLLQKSNTKESFGQTLIAALSEKLEADIQISSENGTQVLLCIHDYKKSA